MSTNEIKDENIEKILETYTEIAQGLRQKMWIMLIVGCCIALAIIIPFASSATGGGTYVYAVIGVLLAVLPASFLLRLEIDKIDNKYPNFKEFYREYSKASDKREGAALLRIAGKAALIGFVVAGGAAIAANEAKKDAQIRDIKQDLKDIRNKLDHV